jgi:excisionase family DNA binding protein
MSKTDAIKFYTIKEIADALRVSEKSVRRKIESSELRAHKFGRLWRISEQDLKAYFALHRSS